MTIFCGIMRLEHFRRGSIMKKSKRMVLSVALVSCVLCLTGCDETKLNIKGDKAKEVEEEDKRITVKVDTPKVSSISIDGDFIGMIESEEQVYVVSKLSGDVTETYFEVGDYVNEGDLLFTVDDTAAQIQLKQAKASLSSANASLNTAQAGVNTANANVNYQTASVTENFAKASTTDKQLSLAIEQAEVNFANNEVNIGTLETTLDELKSQRDKLDGAIASAKANSAVAMQKVAEAQAAYTVALSELRADPGNPGKNLDFTVAEQNLAAAKAMVPSVDSLESQRGTLNNSIKQTEASLRTAKNSNCLIVDQADIARDQKSDYDNYTKATIGNGGLASLASAQAGVVQAEAGVIQSKAGITQAQAAVEAAQLQLDYANVIAPVSGIITSKGVTKNNMTSTGSVAYTIMSDGVKYVTFSVSETVMRELYVGQNITVDRNGTMYDAVITENSGVADAQSGLFKVKAKVNAGGDIVNGVMVKLTLATQHADNVMVLPIDAVYHESEKSYVYTYVGGKANKVYVETGLFDNDSIEITSGISESDQIITTWSSQLRNGVEVKVEDSISMNNSQSNEILVERD